MVTAADRERYERAKELFNGGHGRRAYEIYEQLAREGDTHAQVFVGWMLYGGNGVEKNESLGLEWFRRASSLGSAIGAFYLGRALAIAKKYSDALPLFRQGADKEYSPALLWLGLSYVRGYGVPVDLEKGFTYLRRSAELGNLYARRELAVLMIKGKFGISKILQGLVLLPYYAAAAIAGAWSNPESERWIG